MGFFDVFKHPMSLFDAGAQAYSKSLDHALELAYKDGYDKGFSDGLKASEKIPRLSDILQGKPIDNPSE